MSWWRTVACLVLTLSCEIALAQRDWTEVPGLRAFVEGSGGVIEVPMEGGFVSIELGKKAALPLLFEPSPSRYDRAEFDFREKTWRNTFHVMALLGGDLPVRAVLVDGEWVDRVPLRPGPVVGIAVETDFGDRFDRYTVHSTEHPGLYCITRNEPGRYPRIAREEIRSAFQRAA